jgi:hypothetical protein
MLGDIRSTREPSLIARAVRLSVLLVAVAVAGCVSAPALDVTLRAPIPEPALRFGVDTFAFANENRFKYRGKPDLYANWCFVMARAISQFHRFARFDPAGSPLTVDEYTERVRQVTARPPWHPALSAAERIVIPGYGSLYELSQAQERAVKAGLTGRILSWLHWTNWRVVYPMPSAQQEAVARETLAELQAGRPVQWLVTNLPVIDLNHTVVVYGYRANGPQAIDFTIYDPNDSASPGTIRFEVPARQFWATRLYDHEVGVIRAFRMYYSPLW